jgi:hypothetical protein
MSPPLAALIAAALLAAAPAGAGELHAAALPTPPVLGAIPAEELEELAAAALPPPPTTVIRETRYYGTVTIDHRAHLARRASCKTCHGAGVVTKLVFTPKLAHQRCVGCHEEQARGPTRCQGCHVRPPPPPPALAEGAIAAGPRAAAPPGPNPANVAAALAALEAPSADPGRFLKEPFQRYLELGLAAGRGVGPSVRLAAREGSVLVTTSVERQSSGASARTLAVLGAGRTHGRGRVSLEAVGLAGVDVVERPQVALLPAIGGRAGVEWRFPHAPVQRVAASLTGMVDLSSGPRSVGGVTLYATVATGFRVP